MSTRTKPTAREIERILIEDANNPNAWEEPITVPPASSSRPSWYGRSKPSNIRQSSRVAAAHTPAEPHLIGEMAMWFANLELYLELAIWQLVAAGDETQQHLMEAVTAEMSFDRKVHAFGSLYKLRFPDESDDPELRALVKELFIVYDERNAILHSGWSYSSEAQVLTRMKASAKAKNGLRRRMYAMPPERLVSIRDHIGEVGQRFARFSMARVQKRIAPASIKNAG